MPADCRGGIVFRDQRLLQALDRQSGDVGGALAERQQPLWQRVGFPQLPRRVVVAPAEGYDASSPQEAVELERRERQQLELLGVVKFLVRADGIFAIKKAFGQARR